VQRQQEQYRQQGENLLAAFNWNARTRVNADLRQGGD